MAGARFAGLTRSGGPFVAVLVVTGIVVALVTEFLTQSAPVPGLPEPTVAVRYGIIVARTVLDLAIVAVMGLALLSKLMGFDDPDRTEPVMERARPVAVWASWAWVGAALVSIVLLSAEVYPQAFPRRTSAVLDLLTAPLSVLQYLVTEPDLIWQYIGAVPAGKGLLVCACIGLISVLVSRSAVRRGESVPAEMRAGVAAFGVLPLPLTGHASPWKYHDLVMISMEFHIVAAAAWAGGLAACLVYLARKPLLLGAALPRFSRLATTCVLVVAVSGTLTGIAMLATAQSTVMPEAIWTTHYGQLMLVKLVCIGAIGLLALKVRVALLPRIAAGRPTAVAVWSGFELLVMAAAYGVAVVLTRSAPY